MNTVALYVNDELPAVAAALLRERAMLQLRGEVYVRPYTRGWPGGLAKARKSKRHLRALRLVKNTPPRRKNLLASTA